MYTVKTAPRWLACLLIAVPAALVLNASAETQGQIANFVMYASGAWAAFMVISWIGSPIKRSYLKLRGRSLTQEDALDGLKLCPYCCEEIKAAATICKHCRSNVKKSIAPTLPAICLTLTFLLLGFQAYQSVGEAQDSIASLSSELEEVKDHADSSASISDVESNVEEVKSDVADVQSDVDTVRTDVDNVTADVALIQAKLALLER